MSATSLELADQRIGLIGAGAMGEALAGGLREAGLAATQIQVADPDAARCKRLEERFGVRAAAGNAQLVAASDIVVLAVKPSLVSPVLEALSGTDDLARPLWISIAAGVTLAKLAAQLPETARIIRAMPNTPAQVGAGATALCGNQRIAAGERAAARALFESVGVCWEAPEESMLDAVTGLSGSGPAYVFVLIEALAESGVRAGLPSEAARLLAVQTVLGAAQLARDAGRDPAELRRQVSSSGGTTLAGLERLEAGGFREAVRQAVAAATQRSREIGRGS
jgi:pyrroline-5-carboxylate reductase